jgi:hypothetical protein
MSEQVDYLKREIEHKDAEINRLEQIIATLRAGLNVIARTEHHEQSEAKCMQYEAHQTLRVAQGDRSAMWASDKAFSAVRRALARLSHRCSSTGLR